MFMSDILRTVKGAASHTGGTRPVAGRFRDWLSRGRRDGVRLSLGSVLWPCHRGSHPPPSHRRAVSRRGSLRGGRASRHFDRHGSRLFRGNPSPGLPTRPKRGWSAARLPPRADGGSRRNPYV